MKYLVFNFFHDYICCTETITNMKNLHLHLNYILLVVLCHGTEKGI